MVALPVKKMNHNIAVVNRITLSLLPGRSAISKLLQHRKATVL